MQTSGPPREKIGKIVLGKNLTQWNIFLILNDYFENILTTVLFYVGSNVDTVSSMETNDCNSKQ